MVKYVSTIKKDQKDQTYLMMIMRFFSDLLFKGICWGVLI